MALQTTNDAAVLEIDRFEWTGSDRIELVGTWTGLRARRFVRPTLVLVVEGEAKRLLAVLDHKPWAADDGDEWIAVFPWDGDPVKVDAAELHLGAGLDLDLPAPRMRPGKPRRFKQRVVSGELAARGAAAEAAATVREPPPAPDPAEQLRRELDVVRSARDHANLKRDEANASRDEAITVRNRAVAAREDALAARQRALEACDKAVQSRKEAERERDHAFAERDRALRDRDQAQRERDQAFATRDAADAERAAALDERDTIVSLHERDLPVHEPRARFVPAADQPRTAAEIWTPRAVAISVLLLFAFVVLHLFAGI